MVRLNFPAEAAVQVLKLFSETRSSALSTGSTCLFYFVFSRTGFFCVALELAL